ncbi:RNA binding motif-containing protein [Spironucleus salmonicida]|uniref:RNA binding motif-containing protein n=1 Tax=Spironucleus salmonicida TaxID=348837 RepID=A0A9P8LPQ9_9EUKA|nr:RNA binding motif-containing protein [Spironucleus salmonicida]KAH0572080.1 RNA binding motif-containing protein [Spironucleus salmonicida]
MEFIKDLLLRISDIGVIGVNDGVFDRDFRPDSEDVKDQRVTREILKEVFGKFGFIKHVDYAAGKTEAVLRFSEQDVDATKNVMEEFAETPLVLGQNEVKLSIVSGDEEAEVYKNIRESFAKRGDNRGGFNGGDRRGGYNDRRGGDRDGGDRRGGYNDRRGGDRDGGDRRGGYEKRDGGDRRGGYERRDYK